MSAYIVADKTINRIVSTLDVVRDYEHFKRRILEVLAPKTANWQKELGEAMAKMNIAAVDARYGAGTAVTDFGADMPYQYSIELPDRTIQAYKSLSCFLYQCCEGKIADCPLYKILENYQHGIADPIITNLPEYESAVWA